MYVYKDRLKAIDTSMQFIRYQMVLFKNIEIDKFTQFTLFYEYLLDHIHSLQYYTSAISSIGFFLFGIQPELVHPSSLHQFNVRSVMSSY